MSMTARSRRPGDVAGSPSGPVSAPPGSSVHFVDTEAPEQAVLPREAPEWRSDRQAEAPDAGEGHRHHFEQDFTHGRSQS